MNGKKALRIGSALLVSAIGWAQSQGPGVPNSERLIASIQGPDLYQAYCAVCHGKDAKGNGPLAANLKTKPSDLTRLTARKPARSPLAELRAIISGEGPAALHGTREMPVWGPIFSEVTRDQDLGRVRIDNLARYLESIQVKE